MSERRDLGPVSDVTAAAAGLYIRLNKFALLQKAEIMSIMQLWLSIELAREQRARHADIMATAATQPWPEVRDE